MKFEWDPKKNTLNIAKHGMNNDIIRIISAREATRQEIKLYEEGFS